MLDFNTQKMNCTGCAACYSICPVKCITMQKDEEGFLYPESNDECIHCGLCEKTCPIVNPVTNTLYDNQKCYAAITKDIDTWKKSSSGGAFSEICKTYGNQDTLIVGAAWKGLEVGHICVRGVNNIAPLRKSKYVASPIGETYIKVKKELINGGKVIFSGTPCQVAGLKGFLKKDYENLLTIDLICHGVGSPEVFKQCIKLFEKEKNEIVLSYEFRYKRNKYETDHISCIETDKSKKLYSLDRYNQLFLEQLCLRPSCSDNCRFRDSRRQGDITLADFKGLAYIYPQLVANCTNYSTVTFNTSKATIIKKELEKKLKLFECNINDIIRFNPLFAGHTWSNDNRNIFFDEFHLDKTNTILKWTKDDKLFSCHPKIKIFNFSPKIIRKIAMLFLKKRL